MSAKNKDLQAFNLSGITEQEQKDLNSYLHALRFIRSMPLGKGQVTSHLKGGEVVLSELQYEDTE